MADGNPAPGPARQARKPADVPSERAVFVGDTAWDMKAADAHAVYRAPAGHLLTHLDSGVPDQE